MIFLLIIAGHEGSVALIGNAVATLLEHPGQLELLLRDPGLLDSTVAEVMRYDGPMELAAWRFATEPVQLGGTVIPAGAPVVIALASAHRDPERYARPEEFLVEREDNAHLGFGHGVHFCLGARLGLVEAGVALRTLLDRLPGMALAEPAERLSRQPSFIVRGFHSLPVMFGSPGRCG